MRKLITADDVKMVSFYKLPKMFFTDPYYMPMRLESKLAYMLLLDLFSLSVKNNWVNEKGEVYVSLSRTKLMELLHIKGSQKAAAVMKELVDYGLILNQRAAGKQCNKVFFYKLEPCPGKTDFKKPSPKASAQEKANPRPQDDPESVEAMFANQLHLEDLRQRYQTNLLDEVCNNIYEMYHSKSSYIGQDHKPRSMVRSVLTKLEMHHIEHVIDQFQEVASTTEIRNPRRYLQTMIYNSVQEANSKIISHVKYHLGY